MALTVKRILETEMEFEVLNEDTHPDKRRSDMVRKLVEDLRSGRKVTDFRFDQVYPPAIRKISQTHWTPIEVICRAAELLVANDGTKVLDVGSGCGKFCTVAALSGRGNFIGVEQRPHLADVARKVADELGAGHATFIHGNMSELDWSNFDSFYLFNPFYENKMKSIRIDDTISHNQTKFDRYVETVKAKLRIARPGTKVATYHGFGGEMPLGYHLIQQEALGTSTLELWIKLNPPNLRNGLCL